MKLFIFLCLSQALLCTLVCGHHGGPHDDDDHDHHHNETETFLQLTTANVKFSYKLYYHLAAAYPNDNLFFSPLSTSIAFSLLSLGAKSKTLHQIQEGFSFNTSLISEQAIHKGFQKLLNILNQPKSGLHLDIANALFIDNKLKILDKFLEDAKKFYQSEAISTDFQKAQEALEQINSYVEKKTNGKIKDLLDNLDPLTALVIVNTIFFKGSWEHPFNVDSTNEEDFHVDENTVVKVPMMHRRGEYITGYVPEIECTVVDVPYKGNTSAVFMLPNKGKLLRDVEKATENLSLEAYNKAMKPREIMLSIPKFTIAGEIDLMKELQQLGITEVFSDHADLSGITEDSGLKLSKAMHKAVLTVDEEGTEAAADTTVVGTTKNILLKSVKIDRPFLFAIYSKDLSCDVFSGRIIDPTK
nr:alkaloid-binding globulin [Epipedobates tricolor]